MEGNLKRVNEFACIVENEKPFVAVRTAVSHLLQESNVSAQPIAKRLVTRFLLRLEGSILNLTLSLNYHMIP